MKTIERILLKVTIIQLICLLISQLLLPHLETWTQFNHLIKYEGVYEPTDAKIVETFHNRK